MNNENSCCTNSKSSAVFIAEYANEIDGFYAEVCMCIGMPLIRTVPLLRHLHSHETEDVADSKTRTQFNKGKAATVR